MNSVANTAIRSGNFRNNSAGFSFTPGALGSEIREHSTFAATIVTLYVFLLTSRVLDVSFIGYFHIPLMLMLGLTVTMLAKGNMQFAYTSKITKYFTAFTAWVVICWPFSIWRGGSLPSVQMQVQALLIYLIILQLVRTRKDWEKVASGYAYATLAAALMSFYIGVAVQGRVALPGGTLGDPNEFAMFMVMGLPFWWLKASRSKAFRKAFFLLCTIPIYLAFARTGSRSGMLGMGVLLLTTFLFATGGRKVLICVLAVGGLAAATLLLPGYLKARYMTFFAPNSQELDAEAQQRISADIQSSEGRKQLLIQSIKMSFKHPLFGVGPGVFYIVGFEERKAETGHGGAAYQSHNTYTQISSETGFPGLIFYIGTVVLCFRYTLLDYRRLKDVDPEFAMYGRYMICSMAALSLGIFFLSLAYTYLISILFALSASLHIMVETYLAGLTKVPAGGAANPTVPTLPPQPKWAQKTPAQRPQRRPARWRSKGMIRPRTLPGQVNS